MSKQATIRVLVVDDEIGHADVMAEAITRMPPSRPPAAWTHGVTFSVKQAHNLADARRLPTRNLTWS